MLKKISYITLASLLVFSTVGFDISRHYCGQLLVSVSLVSQADRCCSDMDGNCCHDENEYVVLKVDFTQSAAEQLSIAVINIRNVEFNSLLDEALSSTSNSSCFTPFIPKPGTNKFLSIIQSYLL
ncbi:MAG: hypothetical protein L3J31_00410 [Bacteroidales bacterium]|nr:hypothetical protein [Bacteroidales bacterium]MCF6341252.1 hypothetical protein [Bacteroidales bacterium]